jgi:hypothetical protein
MEVKIHIVRGEQKTGPPTLTPVRSWLTMLLQTVAVVAALVVSSANAQNPPCIICNGDATLANPDF